MSDEFNTSSDIPFVLRGGDGEQTALYNRVAAINRINYLVQEYVTGFDIRQKSKEYLMCLDMELYKKYYQDDSKKKIDEEFCQRSAEVCLNMEGVSDILVTNESNTSSDATNVILETVKPKNFFERIIEKIKK